MVLLTGPHGSGKTTLADALSRRGVAVRLCQYTTRPRREGESEEYRFVASPPADALWSYVKAGAEYGFSAAELNKLPLSSVGVVAVHTEAFADWMRRVEGVRMLTVGLDTLAGHEEQLARVGHIAGRVQSAEAFEESKRIAERQEICLSGIASSVLEELARMIGQIQQELREDG